jgi:hypothetical protein
MFFNLSLKMDAPSPWGLFFQDSATPQMEGLEELHNNIMFYLAIILFGVTWIMVIVVRNFIASRSPISHKYMNHGKYVPIRKYSMFNNILKKEPSIWRDTYISSLGNPIDDGIDYVPVYRPKLIRNTIYRYPVNI